jgi:hypothetical protein
VLDPKDSTSGCGGSLLHCGISVVLTARFGSAGGLEETNRPRQYRVCLCSLNRLRGRRKADGYPRCFQGRACPRARSLERAHLPCGAGESLIAHTKSRSSELCDGDASCVFERARLQPGYRGPPDFSQLRMRPRPSGAIPSLPPTILVDDLVQRAAPHRAEFTYRITDRNDGIGMNARR